MFEAQDKIPGPDIRGNAHLAHGGSYCGVRHEKDSGKMFGSLSGVHGPWLGCRVGFRKKYFECLVDWKLGFCPILFKNNRGRWQVDGRSMRPGGLSWIMIFNANCAGTQLHDRRNARIFSSRNFKFLNIKL